MKMTRFKVGDQFKLNVAGEKRKSVYEVQSVEADRIHCVDLSERNSTIPHSRITFRDFQVDFMLERDQIKFLPIAAITTKGETK